MYQLNASKFVEAVRSAEYMRTILESTADQKSDLQDNQFTEGDGGKVTRFSTIYDKQITNIKRICNLMEAQQTALFAEELLKEADTIPLTVGDAHRRMNDILSSLRRELSADYLYVCSRQYAKYMSLPKDLEELFQTNFERSKFDLVEAGRCLAFGRATACVMHLMRALEQPLGQFATALNVVVDESDSWGTVLSKVRTSIKMRDVGSKWKDGKEKMLFHEAAGALRHIQVGTRDPAMHAVKEKFTEEEAQLEYENIKRFLVYVAKNFPASPAPVKSA
jgi:hypothetical protein